VMRMVCPSSAVDETAVMSTTTDKMVFITAPLLVLRV
jgi:hypothetical protein